MALVYPAEAELIEIIDQQLGRLGRSRDSLLPLLHELQHELGYIDPVLVPHLAKALNISRADVHGVITFYHDFKQVRQGRNIVKFCRAESCQSRGAAALEGKFEARLGVAMGQTRDDGAVTLEAVYCLGLCTMGPNALVNGRPIARLDEQALEDIAAEVAA